MNIKGLMHSVISVQLKIGTREPCVKVGEKVKNETVTAGRATMPATF